MDHNKDGTIGLLEFVDAYVEGEIKLKERLNEIIKAIAERRRQIDEFRMRYEEAKQTEKLNKYGVMENSVLTVHVIRAEELRTPFQESKLLVELSLLICR
jgi:hypothetical protein